MIPTSLKIRAAALTLVSAASTAVAAPVSRPQQVVPPAPAAKHTLFRVRGRSGQTVYLLGSVHLLSAEAATLPAVVDSAFAHAGTVAFETSIDSVKMRGQEMLLRGRYPAGTTLRSSLSATGLARADTLLHSYGLTLDQVNGFKPWLVSVLISQVAMQRANFQSQFGVDVQLDTRAREAGKTIVPLESVDFQLGMFDRISPADQEKMLLASHAPADAARSLARVKDAWIAGDVVAIDSLINAGTADTPTLYAELVSDRNNAWIPKIEALLKGDCDALVVVGAGHIVGKHGLVELLRAKGYTVEQL